MSLVTSRVMPSCVLALYLVVLAFFGGQELAAASCSAFGTCNKDCGYYGINPMTDELRCLSPSYCVYKDCSSISCSGCGGICTGAYGYLDYTDYCAGGTVVLCPCN